VLDELGMASAALESASENLERAAVTTGSSGTPVCGEVQRDRLVELRRE
jgi:hypothetical protein